MVIDSAKATQRNDMFSPTIETELTYSKLPRFDIPDHVWSLLISYMKQLGPVNGAIDMRLTAAGDFAFLEINPAGQWPFVAHGT